MRVNYTTYDMRRDQDSINPRTHADIMMLAPEWDPASDEDEDDWHPYLYGRVCGIFHANVRYRGPGSKQSEGFTKMEFLWVRWYKRDTDFPWGFAARRLPQIEFIPADDRGAFGFLDPSLVIRSAHIIPSYGYGKTQKLMGPSLMRRASEGDEDWILYTVNM